MTRRHTDQDSGAARHSAMIRRGTEPASVAPRRSSPAAGASVPSSNIPQRQHIPRASTWSSMPSTASSSRAEHRSETASNGGRSAVRRLLGQGAPDEVADVIGITCRTSRDGSSRQIHVHTKVEVDSPHGVISLDHFASSEEVNRIRQHIIEYGLVSANNRLAQELVVYIDDTTRRGEEPSFRYRVRERSPGPGIRKRSTA